LAYLGSSSSALTDFNQIDSRLAAKLGDIRARNLLDHLPVLRAFNVKYVLSNFDLSQHSDLLRRVFTSPIQMLDPGSLTEVYVYEVIGAMPRAYLVPNSIAVRDAEEAMDTILSGQVDPTRAVILERQTVGPADPHLDPARSSVKVASYRNTELSMDVQTDGSGFLVVNDTFAPGWQAWVDGIPTAIEVANGWVRAVPISTSGNHSVRMSYTPPMWNEGLLASAISAVLCLALILFPLVTRSRTAQPSPGEVHERE
jgi:hypothetical protein